MIAEDYVSYEIAKLLKEKGFNEATFHDYDEEGKRWFEEVLVCHNSQGGIACPTLQMAIKWLREVHSILVVIDYNYECTSKSYCYKIYCLGKNGKPKRFPVEGVAYDDEGNANRDIIYYRDFQLSDSEYATYEQAVDGALYYCLEYLI